MKGFVLFTEVIVPLNTVDCLLYGLRSNVFGNMVLNYFNVIFSAVRTTNKIKFTYVVVAWRQTSQRHMSLNSDK